MDVNGTRFQLLVEQDDWRRCRLEGQPEDMDGWFLYQQGGQPSAWLQVDWEPHSHTLTLRPLLSLFPRGQRTLPLQPSARRGAALDRFGNWYWISNDQQQIFWQPFGHNRPQVYWTQTAAPAPAPPGEFAPQPGAPPQSVELAGLAVTEHHYLIAGNVTQGGLFIFDLHAGGEPLLLLFPEIPATPPERFTPFDLAPAPGGGVWILDRLHRAYWGLDRNFRIVTEPALMHDIAPEATFTFRPVGGTAVVGPSRRFPTGFPLAAQNPVSIEAMPDGSVLILESPAPAPTSSASPVPSTLYHYRYSERLHSVPLEDDVEVVTDDAGTMQQHLAVIGHDLAYTPGNKTLYVVERDGNQSIAFTLDFAAVRPLSVQREYLPMQFFGGRALVARDETAFYDVAGGNAATDTAVRWVQLHVIDQPRYQRMATLLTPIFDGKERNCVWHRLCVDACIPPETNVEVWSRAENDRQLLEVLPFTREPQLYLRGAGAELPYYQPFPERQQQSEATGTWELLFQRASGRYFQIRLVITGNGRTTPHLRALRAYYPRFSYVRQYLPAVYQEDAESAVFLERFLANPEGFYTDIEGKIAGVSALFDARSAPAETLNWLAGWLGLVLDPLWARIQERRQSAGANEAPPAPDRRRLFIRYAMTLYDRRGTPDGLRFALHLLLHPCLEATLQRFKTAAVQSEPDQLLRDELSQLGLPYPTPVTSEEEFEALLHDYVLTPRRSAKIRIVERFQTRHGRAAVAGDPTGANAAAGGNDTIQASAHRFSVLVPEGLLPEEMAMVERIVQLEKPAHTLFDVRRYWDYFRVGEARLGMDTVLGKEGRFVPIVLGRNYLADGYLSPAYPMDVAERLIADRDRPGERPL
jgi:phage tail-like protein